jgi:hypothetical protein
MRQDYQVAICPHCGEETVRIPISSWDTSYEKNTGIQGFFPNARTEEAECNNGCFITRVEKKSLEVVDFMWSDE